MFIKPAPGNQYTKKGNLSDASFEIKSALSSDQANQSSAAQLSLFKQKIKTPIKVALKELEHSPSNDELSNGMP